MKKIIFISLAVLFFSNNSLCSEEQFSFVAEVNTDNVNARTGSNVNFESICKLNKGEKVVVVDKIYNWYKIKLPQRATCYISSDYVKEENNNKGKVTANRVNLRAGAGINFNILGQLNKDDKVQIIEKVNGWLKIKAHKICFGWVYDKFLSFYSNVIEPEITEKPLEASPQEQKEDVSLTMKVEEYVFKSTGIIKSTLCLFDCRASYKLVDTNNKIICFVKGDNDELKKLINVKVEISGDILDYANKIYPLIKYKKIDIIQ